MNKEDRLKECHNALKNCRAIIGIAALDADLPDDKFLEMISDYVLMYSALDAVEEASEAIRKREDKK